jgi:integrase
MLLTDWLPIYVSRKLDLEPTTVGTYQAAVNKFSRWKQEKFSSPLDTKEITVDLVSDWLVELSEVEKLKPRSINSYRSSINAVWTGAMRSRESPAADSRLVPSCRIPKTIPLAWSLEELTMLVEAAKKKRGRRRNAWKTLRRDFWAGLYLFLYDTGARFGAAIDLNVCDVDIRRKRVLLRAESSKTKTDHLCSISEETSEILKSLIADGYERVWPNGVNRQQLYEEHKRTLQSLGLPFDRYHMFHCFRKTTATQLAIVSSEEDASKALGHSSVSLTRRTYIDARQLPTSHLSSLLPRPGDDPDDDGERSVIKFSKSG